MVRWLVAGSIAKNAKNAIYLLVVNPDTLSTVYYFLNVSFDC